MTTHPTATRIKSAEVEFIPRTLITPLQLSSGTIENVTEARVKVQVETGPAGRQRGVGRGSVYLSDLWAWPRSAIDHPQRDRLLRDVCRAIAERLPDLFDTAPLHPLEMGLRLDNWVCHDVQIEHNPPVLARAMCASPFDAAIHDAVGQAHSCSAFQFYEESVSLPSADPYFPRVGAAQAIRNTLQQPRTILPAWFIVGRDDRLETTVRPAIDRRGYRCFKLKITGSDSIADVRRTVDVYRFVRGRGIGKPRLTVDSNEANPDAASVREYLELLKETDSDAFDALAYLEQPTSRDIRQHAFDWHPIAAQKPVLLDEGLTDLEVLETARRQGWRGFALKTCKGHSMLLAAAAWGHQHGMLLSLQDLTNPGFALIHAALVGAHLPTINGAELNSPQFTPAANAEFLPRLADLFEPSAGVHRIPSPMPAGLGSML